MPDQDETEEPAGEIAPEDDDTDDVEYEGGMFSAYGIVSAVLGLVCVAAVVIGGLIWTNHNDDSGERIYLSKVMQAAYDWSNVLINMNSGNLDASLQRLHDGTVGELNTDFEATMQGYRQVAAKLQAQSVGRVESVAIDTMHRDLDSVPGAPRQVVTTKLPAFATRTDSVMLVATSVAEKTGAPPQVMHLSLRLDVSQIDGKLMISKLELIR